MEIKSGSLDYWRDFFRTANSDIFDIIDAAMMVAASDCPQEFRLRRDRIAERLFNCRMIRCTGCERVELTVNVDEDGDSKSGSDTDGCELQAKESKVNSSRDDDHGDINMNQTSNFSYGEVEALTDEIEEEGQIIEEVLRIKEILSRSQDETESNLFESLRRLQLMELSVHILKATEIGKAVNRLRKHGSRDIRQVARCLIDGWKEMVDEWVNATKAIAESTPDSVNPSVVDEEGLPSPPLDEGAFFATETMELSKFFDGMDDFGNPRSNGELNKNLENGRKISPGNQGTVKPTQQAPRDANALAKNRGQQTRKPEASARPVEPSHAGSGPGRFHRPNTEQKVNTLTKPQKELDNVSAHRRPLSSQPDKSKCSDEVKLEAAKRRLHERYQQAENAKRQRTIQVMELRDLPKQGLGHRNSYIKPGSNNRHWANGRR